MITKLQYCLLDYVFSIQKPNKPNRPICHRNGVYFIRRTDCQNADDQSNLTSITWKWYSTRATDPNLPEQVIQ